MSDFLFSYGTLLPENAPDEVRGLAARFRRHGDGSVRGVLVDLGDYPGAILDDSSDQRVFGTVFRLSEDTNLLDELDRYEGFNPVSPESSLFVRKLRPVTLGDGSIVESWIYEYNGSPMGARVIASGRYLRNDVAPGDPPFRLK